LQYRVSVMAITSFVFRLRYATGNGRCVFLTGAQLLIELLIQQGATTVFGYPGGAVLPIYDALYDCQSIQHILVRHEQAAVHAADGYARVTGKPGVALVTSGPGATNAITGIATAYMDSVPMVVLTGQVSSNLIGLDSFQEVDIYGMTMPITKHNFMVMDIAELPRIIKSAFHLATTGRPGPVLIDLPKNIMQGAAAILQEPVDLSSVPQLKGYKPDAEISGEELRLVFDRLAQAQRPALLVGGGCMAEATSGLLLSLAEQASIPVVSTMMGLGAFPTDHPLHLGMVGMHGTVAANKAVQQADVLLCLGVRFSDRVSGNPKAFSPHSFKIQVDIDESELNKNVPVDLAIHGSVNAVLSTLLSGGLTGSWTEWNKEIQAFSRRVPALSSKGESLLQPQEVIGLVHAKTSGEAVVATDVGQHQIWTAHHYPFRRPRSFLSSGGLGTMGFGLPAAIGAAVANPGRPIVCISGDGSIQMNIQELMTAVDYGLDLKIVILKNGYLGMVRQWQQLFHDKRYSSVKISSPNFAELARTFGARGYYARTRAEAEAIIHEAWAEPGVAVLEFDVTEEMNVYPMIPPGGDASQTIEHE
jgi:acetolactate synthase-1/2/3 large subunit